MLTTAWQQQQQQRQTASCRRRQQQRRTPGAWAASVTHQRPCPANPLSMSHSRPWALRPTLGQIWHLGQVPVGQVPNWPLGQIRRRRWHRHRSCRRMCPSSSCLGGRSRWTHHLAEMPATNKHNSHNVTSWRANRQGRMRCVSGRLLSDLLQTRLHRLARCCCTWLVYLEVGWCLCLH